MVRTGRAPSSQTEQSDLDLLRRYEPVVRYSKGELFFPTAVAPYVAQCSLWEHSGGEPVCVVPGGRLTLGELCEEALRRPGQPLSLRFVETPLTRAQFRQWRRDRRDRPVGVVRFTTTGMFGRIVDAGFRLSLLLRGTVAAGLSAAAEITYRERLESDRFTYYGRVVRTGGYICLQYWFFYAMNDWRSTFRGVNDHEADWELATVYLADEDGRPPRPAWAAFSSHDHQGDDLRRRWDDPELRRDGDHPVLFAGAGSHSGVFVPGDYVVSVDPPQLRRPIAAARRIQRLLAPWRSETRAAPGLGIPFVDYARGDGRAVGPGQEAGWQAELIDNHTPWVRDYQGLWGLDTEDHFGGERAPAGPRYERNGRIRYSWADPLGWAGLLKVPPVDDLRTDLLADAVAELEARIHGLDQTIASDRSALRRLAVELRSLEAHDYAHELTTARRKELADLEARLGGMIADRASVAEELRIHQDTLSHPLQPLPPQAHIRQLHGPRTDEQQRRTRFLRLWAAVSTPLLLAMVPVILLAQPLTWIAAVAILAFIFTGVEAFARLRFLSFIASSLLLVAIVAACVALVELSRQHWRIAISIVFAVGALLLLIGNLGDLVHGWRRGVQIVEEEEQ